MKSLREQFAPYWYVLYILGAFFLTGVILVAILTA